MLNSSYWAENDMDVLKSAQFISSYGVIIEELKLDEKALAFNFIFLYRRLFYAGIIVFFINHPHLQVIIIISALLMPVFFIIIYRWEAI